MKIEDLEIELQNLHKDFKILKSQKGTGLATVFLYGQPQFSVPIDNIFDDVKSEYGVELPTGSFQRHRTRPEAIAMAQGLLKQMQDPDMADAIMGTGAYSDANLK